jgi:hypothetical protein
MAFCCGRATRKNDSGNACVIALLQCKKKAAQTLETIEQAP